MSLRGRCISMFTMRKKGGGNKFTFISIIMILAVVYVFRLVSPQKEVSYPDTIRYDNLEYAYVETVRSSSVMFVRKRPPSAEGFIILVRRGTSALEEVYIYEGSKKYRRYEVLKE